MKKKEVTPNKLVQNIKRLKKEGGFNQGSLSQKAKLAYHTIAKIEAGATRDPRISTVIKIADVFGVPVDELVK